MYWDQGGHAWGWAGMAVGMTFVWVFVVTVIVVAIGWSQRAGEPRSISASSRPAPPRDARAVLDARLARGEIDVADYEARLSALERAGS